MLTVKGIPSIENVKRCFFNGAVVKLDCPKCGTVMVRDFSYAYLSYPRVGKEMSFPFYCRECDAEFEVPAIITKAEVVIEVDDSKMQEV